MLDNLVIQLAQARATEDELKRDYDTAYEAFKAAHAGLIDRLSTAKNHRSNLEDSLRTSAEALYEDTGDKAPHEAIEIKMFDGVVVEPDAARAWCLVNMPALLQLDLRAYEKVRREVENSKLLSDILTMPGLIVTTAKATVKTNLAPWLPVKPDAAESGQDSDTAAESVAEAG